MSWEQRNHDFSTAQVDAQVAYIEAEREVARLQAENEKLRLLVGDMWCGLYCPTEPGEGCSQCPFNKDGECFFEQRMRELGVDL